MKLADAYVEISARTGKLDNAFKGVRGDLRRLSTGFRSLAKTSAIVFAGLATGAILVGRSFVRAASSMEDYQVRLETLLGSQKKAADAMSFFLDIASEVPFSLDAIASAGVTLEAMGAKHKKWLPVLSDLAAVMGIDVANAASALGRAYAGGAGAADIFRERGILNIIRDAKGIKDLSRLTLPEFRKAMFETFIDTSGRIAGAAKKLAETWTGQLSMVGDSVFKLRKKFGDALLPAMKELVTFTIKPLVNEWVEWAKANKEMLASDVKLFVKDLTVLINGLAKGIRFMLTNYKTFKDIFIIGSLEMRKGWIDLTTTMKKRWGGAITGMSQALVVFEMKNLSATTKIRVTFENMINNMRNLSSRIAGFLGFEKFEADVALAAKRSKEHLAKILPGYTSVVKGLEKKNKDLNKQLEDIAKAQKERLDRMIKAYSKFTIKRDVAALTSNRKIKKDSDETEKGITANMEKENKKRSGMWFGLADFWKKIQEQVFETGTTRGGIPGLGAPPPAGAGAGGRSNVPTLTFSPAMDKKLQKMVDEMDKQNRILKDGIAVRMTEASMSFGG